MQRNTTEGLAFENSIKLNVEGIDISKYKLYKFLEARGIDWKNYLSKRLLPDRAYYSPKTNSIIIYEIKFQKCQGSVDEKLQTAAFKIRMYKRLFSKITNDVKYIYILNSWFKKDCYKDVLEYIKEVEDCDYIFSNDIS